jgi:WD40 repeat protein
MDVRLAWSTYQATMLATTASSPAGLTSPLVSLWDTRTPKAAATILPSSSGASLVAFDRLHPFRLATVHSGNVRIWDTRVCYAAIIRDSIIYTSLALTHPLGYDK